MASALGRLRAMLAGVRDDRSLNGARVAVIRVLGMLGLVGLAVMWVASFGGLDLPPALMPISGLLFALVFLLMFALPQIMIRSGRFVRRPRYRRGQARRRRPRWNIFDFIGLVIFALTLPILFAHTPGIPSRHDGRYYIGVHGPRTEGKPGQYFAAESNGAGRPDGHDQIRLIPAD